MNEFQHRVPKQIRVLAVVEAPCHFIHPVTSTTAATGAVHFKLSRFRRG
jgi:hypothetical protein